MFDKKDKNTIQEPLRLSLEMMESEEWTKISDECLSWNVDGR